jgi:methylated-DNA-protein-cysteine methyltransferase-like protein
MKKKVVDSKSIYAAIFDAVRCIPKGRVTSYGAVGKAIGMKSGARMVGRAMGYVDSQEPKVPVHRVVNSIGILSGEHAQRQIMLEAEGIQVKNNKVMDFKTHFWDPLKEMNL